MLPLMGKLSRYLYIVCYSYILMYNCLKIKFNLTKSGAWTTSRIEQDTSSFPPTPDPRHLFREVEKPQVSGRDGVRNLLHVVQIQEK